MAYIRKLEFTVSFFASILILLPATVLAEAEYYTWVDENGVTNYAEKNPEGYHARHITRDQRFGYRFAPRGDATPAEDDQTSDAAADTVDPELVSDEEFDAWIASEKARIDAEIAQARKNNCAIGRRNLALLEAYGRIRVKDEEGEERVLTDREKQSRISDARKTIRENCTG